MRIFTSSTLILAVTFTMVASVPSGACVNVKRAAPCSLVVTEAGLVVPPPRVDDLGKLVLPPIEALTAKSDYTMFLKPNVPVEIQRRALRKLWLSDPIFAYRDELVSYDEDYTRPGDPGYQYKRHGFDSFARALEK